MTKTTVHRKPSRQAEMMRARGFMAAAEVARRIGRTTQSVYALIESGQVQGVRVGRSWYADVKSLAAYLGPDAARMFGFQQAPVKPAGTDGNGAP